MNIFHDEEVEVGKYYRVKERSKIYDAKIVEIGIKVLY